MSSFAVESVKAPSPGKRVTMMCDECLSEEMKIFPALDTCFNRTNASLIVGGMGSGKTSLAIQWLTSFYKKVFVYIYIVAPVSSLASIKKSPLRALPEDQFYDSLSPSNAADILERVKENSKHGRRSFLLLDDVQRDLKDPDTLRSLTTLVANMRHLRVSIVILAQSYLKVDKTIRNLVSNVLIFSVSKSQLAVLHEEHLSMHPKLWERITKDSFTKPRTFLIYNTSSMRLFRNYDEEIRYE
ncbi:hypothetical protein B484DRAFT_436609 [Ochromonadaceae sp. CCMP2298]|nr:hypothetical protein B484DRAFT_436609 [Ochromonadaceae sp. CCMP2298]